MTFRQDLVLRDVLDVRALCCWHVLRESAAEVVAPLPPLAAGGRPYISLDRMSTGTSGIKWHVTAAAGECHSADKNLPTGPHMDLVSCHA